MHSGRRFSDSVYGLRETFTLTILRRAQKARQALSAGEQRVLLDVSYAGLYGAQDERGYGNAVNLGAVVPTSFAVFGGSLNFLQSPFDALLPLGTSLGVNFTVSKDLTERFYTGIGVSARMGSGRAGVSASLGALYHFGDLAFLRDFRQLFPDQVRISGRCDHPESGRVA